ncbi:MAG: prefoldin subunit alpha [Candidatus Thorarchaeota archaeon]|jgi:prefoldin alpha subunit
MTEDQQQLLQKLYLEQKMAESNITILQQRMEMIQAYLSNYRSGVMVLNELEKRSEGEEMLMNVGGGIFVQSRLINPERVTREIGSNIRIEQSVVEAKKQVEDAITRLEKQYESIANEYNKMVTHAASMSSQLQKLASQMQNQGE